MTGVCVVKTVVAAVVVLLVVVYLGVVVEQFVCHRSPGLVLFLSIGVGAASYSVFIWLTQKEEIGETRELIGGWRGL